jgi:hypothetical protein
VHNADADHLDASPAEWCQNVDGRKIVWVRGQSRKTKRGAKVGHEEKLWWPFIPVTHYMIPLLHCKIGIGNQLLDMLLDIIKKHLENMTRTKERTQLLIPVLWNIISETVAKRDSWDASNDAKLWKTLKHTIANATKSDRDAQDAHNNIEIIAGQEQETQQDTHLMDKIKLRMLEDFCNREFVAKLEKA